MPLYEYKCQSCGKTFEVIQKFSDAPLTTHAECGGGPVEKLISPSAIQFKGTGWYVTDYGKGNGKPAGKQDSSSENKSEAKSETKTEKKTESKTDSSGSSSKSSDSKPAA